MIQEHAAIMHTAIPWALLLLLLLDWNPTAAEPQSFPTDRGNWCSEHRKLHSRLEVVEERVEKTVEYLYSEVSSLLDAISGSTWALSVAPSGPILNIFEEDSR